MKGASRKERERARHREEILTAAEAVFAEKGFRGATTEEIARRAEFAVGTLYNFFPSKEELFTAVMLHRVEQMRAMIVGIFSDTEVDPIAAIESFIEAKARFFSEHMAFFRLLHTEMMGGTPRLTGKWNEKVHAVYHECMKTVAMAIQRGIDSGRLRQGSARDIAMALQGITNASMVEMLHTGEGEPYESKVPVMKELFFHGALAT